MTERRPPLGPLAQLTLARLRLFFREPSTIFWAFGFPIMLSIALGIAFRNRAPEPVRVAVEAGPGAEPALSAMTSPLVQATVEDAATASRWLRQGKVVLVVVPGDRNTVPYPSDLSLRSSVRTTVPDLSDLSLRSSMRTYRYDEARPEARLARLLVDDLLQRAEGRRDVAVVADERVTRVGARYIDFLIPGLVGMNLMSGSMWGIGYAIVEMRTKKLVKRMLATPMRRSDFLLSFVLMRALFVVVEVPVLFGFGWIAFGVPVLGSKLLLLALSFLGAFTFGGLGLLVASRAQNTQTVGGLMNVVMMPMFIGSGVFFSTSNFPDSMQPLLRALPLTALNDSLRAITNDGAPMVEVAAPALVLAAWGLISYGAALKLFRWK